VSSDPWEAFAQDNAEYYICTEGRYSRPVNRDEFFASGRGDVERILGDVGSRLQQSRHALEVGCGVGRLTIPMAEHFERVTAVDVAPTMLVKLAENAARFDVQNITPCLADDEWDRGEPVDLAYSFIVFQHVAAWDAIERYVRRIGSCLAEGGIGYLHFDTRPATMTYRARGLLPDPLLPRSWRRGIRRVRRSRTDLLALFGEAGLVTVDERGPDGPDDIMIVTRRN
jgi:SAM-dependent methyltransferase